MTERLIVLVGPSGSGKTTIAAALERRLGAQRIITCTSRNPRQGEVNGKDYRFFTWAEFMSRVHRKEFFEHANVHQNLYGTLKEDINLRIHSYDLALLIMDIQGAELVHLRYPKAQIFFITAPIDQLAGRLGDRGDTSLSAYRARYEALSKELRGSRSDCVRDVIDNSNGKFNEVVEQICSIVTGRLKDPYRGKPRC